MYVLGIDAGGTKTVCYLADSEGRIVGEGAAAVPALIKVLREEAKVL